MSLKLHPLRETPASHMQEVCEVGTVSFLGWQHPRGSNLKLSAGRSDVGCRYWPRMKQWLCMLQGILLSMRSPRLRWAFFTQPVIYNRGLRKSNDFKYPRECFPGPTEWSSFSSPAVPLPTEHWPPIQAGFTSCVSAVEMQIAARFALPKDPYGLSDKTSFPSYLIFLISSFMYSFIRQIFIECLLCTGHHSNA